MKGLRLLLLLFLVGMTAAQAARVEEWQTVELASGTTVGLRLVKPQAGGPWPAIVLMGGLERGAQALDLVPPNEDEAVLVGFDYPLSLPRELSVWQILSLAGAVEHGIADTSEMPLRIHERLCARADVDCGHITVVGVSLGAPFALIAAERSPYAGVVLLHGFGDVPGMIRHQFERRWRARYGLLGTLMAALAQRIVTTLVDFPAPEESARRLRSTQQVLVGMAESDEFVPESSREALLTALRMSPARLTVIRTPGGHVRGRNAEVIRALFDVSAAWMRQQRLLGPYEP